MNTTLEIGPKTTGIKPPGARGWWSPVLSRAMVQKHLNKRDLPGLVYFTSWLALLALTTSVLWRAWGTAWVVPAVILHGAILSVAAYAASHECAHGTAFRTRWLNEGVFYLTSFVFGEEPMYRRYSHGRHHIATWYPGFDSQMPYGNPMTYRAWLWESLGVAGFLTGISQMTRHATRGLNEDERNFVPAGRVRQLVYGSRLFLLGYAAIIAASVTFQSWALVVGFFGARLSGGWVAQLYINSQHMCMAEAVPDHRYSTRSLSCSHPMRILYWNMNFHIEHHLFPGVPFHMLPAIQQLIKDELPTPTRGALAANIEILRAIRRQRIEPGYSIQPLFSSANGAPDKRTG